MKAYTLRRTVHVVICILVYILSLVYIIYYAFCVSSSSIEPARLICIYIYSVSQEREIEGVLC